MYTGKKNRWCQSTSTTISIGKARRDKEEQPGAAKLTTLHGAMGERASDSHSLQKKPQLGHKAASQGEKIIKNHWETNSAGFCHKELDTSKGM